MARKKLDSRGFRKLAEEVVEQFDVGGEWSEEKRDEIATSLVRQWVTYDGNALFFRSPEERIYLVLGKTALGQRRVIPEPMRSNCLQLLTHDWNVDPNDLTEIIDQLNRGQSVEFTSGEGIPLRLWVNPKERSQGIEPLAKLNRPTGERNDHKLAVRVLMQALSEFDTQALDPLAAGIVKQWREFQGYACLFLNAHEQLAFRLVEQSESDCIVHTDRLPVDLTPLIARLVLPPELFENLLAQLNLGQRIELREPSGRRSVLWHDPRERQIHIDSLDAPEQAELPPFLCPKCQAVLPPWEDGQQQLSCPLCCEVISRG